MDTSPVTPLSVLVTAACTALLLWGVAVGVRQVWQGYRAPDRLFGRSRRRARGYLPVR